MWKLIFNNESNRGVATNRAVEAGEFMRELPPSQCAWFMSEPERYQWATDKIEEVSTWAQEKEDKRAAREAARAALEARVTAIEEAQASADLKQYTVAQAEQWITNTLTDAPGTVNGIKQAVGQILIRMLPYILPKN